MTPPSPLRPLRIGSLFSGIGGLDLGVECETGGHTVWQVERDLFCLRVLARHWPLARRYNDVCVVGEELDAIDILTAGFPCQPASLAGQRKGMDDERWLWPQVERLVRVLRPRFVFLENVPGLFTLGFSEVLGGLAALGYDAEWSVFRASDAGAPHRRERIFILAVDDAQRSERQELRRVGRDVGEECRLSGSEGRPQAGDARRASEAVDHAQGHGCEALGLPFGEATQHAVLGSAGEHGVADPHSVPGPRAGAEREPGGRGQPSPRGARVADADGDGQPQSQGRITDKSGRPFNGGEGMADADRGEALRCQPIGLSERSGAPEPGPSGPAGDGPDGRLGGVAVEPGVGLLSTRLRSRLAGCAEPHAEGLRGQEEKPIVMGYGTQGDSGTTQELPPLQEANGAKNVQRAARGPGSLCAPEFLRLNLLRGSEPHGDASPGHTADASPPSARCALPTVWVPQNGEPSPYRREPVEQRDIQRDDPMRVVSHEVALATRQGAASEDRHAVRDLRQEGPEPHTAWHVPDALPAMEDARRSSSRPTANPLAIRLAQHRWPAGRGQEQHPWEPPRTVESCFERPAKLHALGNAVVPQQAALAWRTLLARLNVAL